MAAGVLAGGVVIVGGYFYVEYLRHGRTGARTTRVAERLPLFGVEPVPSSANGDAPRGGPSMPRPELAGPRRPAAAEPYSEPPSLAMPPRPSPSFARPAYEPALATAPARTNGAGQQLSGYPAARYADGQTLRFALPDDGTLQFLPGRLQVVVGPETGREIRFVRSPNTRDTDVSFGRSEGPPHRHVQLLVPTVSRRHALMSLLDEHWSLQNLSATNPVTHNGRRLAPDEVVPLLVDGDRIEMGEIVFVYHGR